MKLIYGAAGFLVLLALWAAWQASRLIPTDLGNTYLLAASILISAAGLMATLAALARDFVREIRPTGPALVPAGPDPAPGIATPDEDARTPRSHASTAIGAAIMAREAMEPRSEMETGSASGEMTPGSTVDPRLLAMLEGNILAELRNPPPEPEASTDAEVATQEILQAREDDEIDDLLLTPLPPLPDLPAAGPAAPEMPSRARHEPMAAAEPGSDSPAMVDAGSFAEYGSQSEPASGSGPKPDLHSPTPGLLPDEELARLDREEPAFAPLEKLEIVGAYDSGGMRFTMYSDGSVTATGKGIERRFHSLDELRAFIDNGLE